MGRGQTAQLAVQQWDEVVPCLLITATPRLEQARHIPSFRRRHSTTPIKAILHPWTLIAGANERPASNPRSKRQSYGLWDAARKAQLALQQWDFSIDNPTLSR
jgi:hypothetical protein